MISFKKYILALEHSNKRQYYPDIIVIESISGDEIFMHTNIPEYKSTYDLLIKKGLNKSVIGPLEGTYICIYEKSLNETEWKKTADLSVLYIATILRIPYERISNGIKMTYEKFKEWFIIENL